MERVYRTWDEWECYPAGFYEDRPPAGMDAESATRAYAEFLRNLPRFRDALTLVLNLWPNSCEHYLSNANMNRIAWLGQASMCVTTQRVPLQVRRGAAPDESNRGVPACFRGGFNLLSPEEQLAADLAALDALNAWLEDHGQEPVTLDGAASKTQMDLY